MRMEVEIALLFIIVVFFAIAGCEKRNDWGDLARGVGEVQRRAP